MSSRLIRGGWSMVAPSAASTASTAAGLAVTFSPVYPKYSGTTPQLCARSTILEGKYRCCRGTALSRAFRSVHLGHRPDSGNVADGGRSEERRVGTEGGRRTGRRL